MFAARAASRVVAPALRAPVRRMGGHDAAEAAVEMSKWVKYSYGALAFSGTLGTYVVITELNHLAHPHESHTRPCRPRRRNLPRRTGSDRAAARAPAPRATTHRAAPRRHLKIRAKPYPWSCPDCNLFDSACWKACKEK
ncbi:phosphoribosylglycinamide formyltransferase [Aureococcus anophagefferens]|nr:phosphoribosylglycinamide formyltransferase [Aureococcus anophagefferens]